MENSLVLFIIFVAIILFVIFLINNPEIFGYTYADHYSLYYEGDVRHFRADLLEANKTLVYPNESLIRDVLLNLDVFKIHIAYIPNENENAFYLASSFEITNKLGIVYRHYFRGQTGNFKDSDGSSCIIFYEDKQTRCFNSLPINSTDELIPTSVEPVILLLGPSHANQTAVTIKNNLIILEGKDFSEIDRKYTDLDLVTDKILLVLMQED